MAPSVLLMAALFRSSSAILEEDFDSMLQMPALDVTMQTESDEADSECACPGYYEDECREHAEQGCTWTDSGDSNAPWCQCDQEVWEQWRASRHPVSQPPAPPPSPWTLVLQYGASAYTPNTNAVGTLNEEAKQFAKLSDQAINALPGSGDYDFYMLTSESATANTRDTLFLRVQGDYADSSPTLGFSSWEACAAATFQECTTWSVAQGGTHGIDTYYPRSTNNCDRWFTGYQNSILCYTDRGSRGRCWSTGSTCSIGSHAIRQDVKMYKLTA